MREKKEKNGSILQSLTVHDCFVANVFRFLVSSNMYFPDGPGIR